MPLAGGAAGSDQLGSMTSDGQAAYLSAGHHSKPFACLLFLQILSWLDEGVHPCCILAKCPLAGRICSPRWINEAPCFWLERAPALQCGCGPAVLPLNLCGLNPPYPNPSLGARLDFSLAKQRFPMLSPPSSGFALCGLSFFLFFLIFFPLLFELTSPYEGLLGSSTPGWPSPLPCPVWVHRWLSQRGRGACRAPTPCRNAAVAQGLMLGGCSGGLQ